MKCFSLIILLICMKWTFSTTIIAFGTFRMKSVMWFTNLIVENSSMHARGELRTKAVPRHSTVITQTSAPTVQGAPEI